MENGGCDPIPRAVSRLAGALLAPNPGPMSLEGTNSYVLRSPGASGCVVVDPGPEDSGHLGALAAQSVELVLITHRHADHTAGIDALHRLTGAPVRALLSEHCRAAEPLTDGEEIAAAGIRIRVLATPGHTSDSLSFLLPGDGPLEGGPATGSMLTGDSILGRGTTMLDFPDGTLADYLATLDLYDGYPGALVLPAHGPVLRRLDAVVSAYRSHRLERLEQISAALASLAARGTGEPTIGRVTDLVYADAPANVRRAAEMSVAAQLHYLRNVAAS
ncbi:MBL fold metallo-hydrolase [Paeniglutamicibacter cryotolerans]|nr:MBL fold metallo-hydrolase [Paeniglutamicibacter cryotolerans]